MTVKTDDVTRVRKDVDPHGRFRGEWVKEEDHKIASNNRPLSLLSVLSKIMLESSPGSVYIIHVHVLLQALAIIQPPEQKS